MKKLNTRVAIAGGGIGGLVIALQCHKRGNECMVFEASEKLEPLGVGINLLLHSVRILAGLGLLDELAASAIETSELAYFNKHGQAIWREPRGIAAGYDFPQFSIHRGELHMLLYRHAVARLGADRVLTGHAIRQFDIGAALGSRATAVLENRRSGADVAVVEASSSSRPTASIPRCARRSTRTRGRPGTQGGCCGAVPVSPRRSSPDAA